MDDDAFPDDHESRVAWATKHNKEVFVALLDEPSFDMDLRNVYCALAAMGMLDDRYSITGTCRQRLFLARYAAYLKIPIIATNVFRYLRFSCCADVITESIAEMVAQGHAPDKDDWDAIVETIHRLGYSIVTTKGAADAVPHSA